MNQKLFNQLESIANKKYGGHYTIYKFTTHYKGVFGTLSEDGFEDIRDKIKKLNPFDKLDVLLEAMILNDNYFNANIL